MQAAIDHSEMRVEKIWPNIDWRRTWKNLSEAPVPEATRVAWYRVIHKIITTNERFHRIKMVQTDTCRQCASKDTLEHHLIVCGEGKAIWENTKTLIVSMLRRTSTRVPDDWIMHPRFHMWPPKRYRALLWMLANVVLFRLQQQRNLTLQDCMDFLQRSKWKLMRPKKGKERVGNYVKVLDAGVTNRPNDGGGCERT
jgi:hypothetical protein